METLTIKVRDNKTLNLIYDLVELDLIQVIKSEKNPGAKNISEKLKGSISAEQAESMHNQVKKMKNEWERDTY